MKKILSWLVLFFIMFFLSDYCQAAELIKSEVKNNDNLEIIISSATDNFYGFSASLNYDETILKIDKCVGKNGFEIYINENIMIAENTSSVKNDEIMICYFNVLKQEDTIIKLENVVVSDSEKAIDSDDIEIKVTNSVLGEKKENVEEKNSEDALIENPKTGSINIFVCVLLLVILGFMIIKIRNKKKLMSFFIFLTLSISIVPLIVFSEDINSITIDDLNYLRDSLLNKNQKSLDYDIDLDNKITINDLIVIKISVNEPKISFESETSKKVSNYYTSVTNVVSINSLSDLKKISYCITEKENCTPNKDYDLEDNKNKETIKIKLNDNANAQRICVNVVNELGLTTKVCDSNSYFVDSKKPNITLTKSLVKIDGDTSYNSLKNIKEVQFGVGGGKTSCTNSTNFKLGDNKVTCTATGNNGLSSSVSFVVHKSNTYNKTAVFYGDSITQGVGNDNKSWAYYLKNGIEDSNDFDLKETINCGKSSWRITRITDKNGNVKPITDVVKGKVQDTCSNVNSADFVILQGGINDIYHIYDVYEKIDTEMFIEGLREYLDAVVKNFLILE